MDIRQGAHDPGQHLSRQGIALGFTESLVIDRNDDDAFRRGARAREKETPVEGQVFDSIQGGGAALGLVNADPNSQKSARRKKCARQQQ